MELSETIKDQPTRKWGRDKLLLLAIFVLSLVITIAWLGALIAAAYWLTQWVFG